MSRVILVRHGQTAWNKAGRLQGATDIELNDTGRRQADIVARALAATCESGTPVIASPLSRAADTAAAIAASLGSSVRTDDRLKERSFGVWEGTVSQERHDAYPEQAQRWSRGEEPAIDGYESQATLMARMTGAITAAGQHAPQVVIVSHGSALRAGICALTGLPGTIKQSLSVITGMDNAHWAQVAFHHGHWSIERYNVRPEGWLA